MATRTSTQFSSDIFADRDTRTKGSSNFRVNLPNAGLSLASGVLDYRGRRKEQKALKEKYRLEAINFEAEAQSVLDTAERNADIDMGELVKAFANINQTNATSGFNVDSNAFTVNQQKAGLQMQQNIDFDRQQARTRANNLLAQAQASRNAANSVGRSNGYSMLSILLSTVSGGMR